MLEHAFTCPLPHGVHARPASAIEEVARPFASDIAIANQRTGQAANAKSVLGIVGLEIRLDDRCVVTVSGPDERRALETLTLFFETQFPHSDDALPPIEVPTGEVRLPAMLEGLEANIRAGTAVVPGIGEGRPVVIGGLEIADDIPRDGVSDVPAELGRLDAALDSVVQSLDAEIEAASGVEGAVLRAHRSVARDPEFRAQLHAPIRQRDATAAGAIAQAEQHFTAMLVATGSALLRERALDIRDVCARLLADLYGTSAAPAPLALAADSICIAESLTPGQFLSLDRHHLRGLVLAHGGTTSHTVILARSFGIPTVVGVSVVGIEDLGAEVIVDGNVGILVTRVTDGARRYYEMERRRLEGRARRLRRFVAAPAATADGRHVEVAANIGTADEAGPAFAAGAEGIGLFRTEMLFVDRDEPPTEDNQFEQYRRVVSEADGRPVIIRTLDVGGDKPIPYLHLPKEDNPFLGYRAVRLYPQFDAIFRSQIAALVRASVFGRLRVMVPMVSGLDEVRWVRSVIAEEQAKAAQAGVRFDDAMQVGAMMEVPSLAFLLDRACAELDFFSIGSNDLLQYFVAADRANRNVAALYNTLNPAFLRLLKKIVDDAHAGGRWVGLCGEMGGQLRALPLLVGLGLDEISMAAPSVASAKAAMASLSSADCATLLAHAVNCSTAAEVESLLGRFDAGRPAPLIEPDLIVLDGDARTKEEAVKQLVDHLYVLGRTDRPREVEDAVWQREAAYSTGFGHGFAIPHCKTDAVRSNSLGMLKLATPVDWGSLDGQPVNVVLLLVIRESDKATEHMKVFAALARKVMHEEFRDRLAAEQDPAALCDFLRDTIGG